MIEVYLPQQPNGCAVVLCPGGAMRWLSWESDVVKMASFLNEHGIAAIGLRYHLNKTPMPQGMKMPPMVDVTHPEVFTQADANPMHTASGDSIIQLAATEQGLATCWVCNFDANLCKEKFGLPENEEPAVIIPLGYAADEAKPKNRKAIDEIVK